MNQGRMRALDCSVNLIIQHGKQLVRSLLLLAHYTTVLVSFTSRSVGWFVEVVRWTVLSVQYVASMFDALHRILSRLNRRCTGTVTKVLTGKGSDSD
ncbi:hypothetical protein Baya_15910 [Bagarius yarrelli]|uniref:Uncharacterized protein n=1 Tax=Bagarius yarrelli TaxID=175774 RepID=A0A556VLF8_BAGYA|nr:hypothetical protein Baya_15910 [Bagarius yarrelli]